MRCAWLRRSACRELRREVRVGGWDWDWDLAEASVVVEEEDSSASEPLCIKGAMLITMD